MADRSGELFDNYQLLKFLGQGQFGEVYLAENRFRKTQVAIKLLFTRFDEKELASFLKEARTVRLQHPNIVAVRDFGIEDQTKTPFIVMDYASGGTLLQRHPRGTRLPLTTILPYVKQIASALAYAHEENLIHRDIKPENILISEQGTLLLSDFGISVVSQSGRTSLGSPQGSAGTPYYMAPEQIQGKPSRASDQYALGVVVYEWFTGQPPFIGGLWEVWGQHLHTQPTPLKEIVEDISKDVEDAVMKTLSKDPKDRFSSILEFATALEKTLTPEPPSITLMREPPSITLTPEPPSIMRKQKTTIDWLQEGNEYHDTQRYAEALAAYSQAILLDSTCHPAYGGRGNVYRALKEYQKALNDYNRALELDPNYTLAYNGRGIVYRALKEYQKALNDYNRALELDPNYTLAYNGRGNVYYELKEFKKALNDYNRALELDPNYTTARTNREIVYNRVLQ